MVLGGGIVISIVSMFDLDGINPTVAAEIRLSSVPIMALGGAILAIGELTP